MTYILTGPSASFFSLQYNVTGVATLVVAAPGLSALVGSTASVTIAAVDGLGQMAATNASLSFPIALSYMRPLYAAPAIVRVSRPGYSRIEVSEIMAMTPAGTNAALGSLVTSTDTHFSWRGVAEFWGPQPAFMASRAITRPRGWGPSSTSRL